MCSWDVLREREWNCWDISRDVILESVKLLGCIENVILERVIMRKWMCSKKEVVGWGDVSSCRRKETGIWQGVFRQEFWLWSDAFAHELEDGRGDEKEHWVSGWGSDVGEGRVCEWWKGRHWDIIFRCTWAVHGSVYYKNFSMQLKTLLMWKEFF
jgi:hypothetical protein